MPGWIIEGFELATNPTKLWRALRKPKEAKNVSPAGVRKEGSERNEAHRRPYCRKRGRSGVIVLLLVLLALAVTAAEGSQDDHVEMPPPPGVQCSNRDNNCRNRIFVAFIAKRRREEAKEMDEEADELQERVKVLRQTLQGCAKQDQDNNCRNRIFVAFIDDTIKYLETLIRRGREAAKRRREEAKEMDEVADELQERVKVLRQVINFPSTFPPRSTTTATTTKPVSPKHCKDVPSRISQRKENHQARHRARTQLRSLNLNSMAA
ncbi:uncharacterized protein [Miscanthus floridulus]|uniref:uncharacterized protein isoform X4 n=1 Tax=Miscanthus floridulus TaxID=154761 RepID=UPI00345B41BB